MGVAQDCCALTIPKLWAPGSRFSSLIVQGHPKKHERTSLGCTLWDPQPFPSKCWSLEWKEGHVQRVWEHRDPGVIGKHRPKNVLGFQTALMLNGMNGSVASKWGKLMGIRCSLVSTQLLTNTSAISTDANVWVSGKRKMEIWECHISLKKDSIFAYKKRVLHAIFNKMELLESSNHTLLYSSLLLHSGRMWSHLNPKSYDLSLEPHHLPLIDNHTNGLW